MNSRQFTPRVPRSSMLVATCLSLSVTWAQPLGIRPRTPWPKPPVYQLYSGLDRSRLVLKLVDDAGARVENGMLVPGPTGMSLSAVQAAIGLATRVSRVFSRSDAHLERERRVGEAMLGFALPDLTQFFFVEVPPGVDPEALANSLNSLPEVEIAYAPSLTTVPPGDIPPTTPDFRSFQTYRASAPAGIGADAVFGAAGGRGRNASIIDVEYAWNLDHEDLMGLGGQAALIGQPPLPSEDQRHGTAVLGILAADYDASPAGLVGLVPDATVRVVTTVPNGTGRNVANAINLAQANLDAGGVILIEQQAGGPNGPCTRAQPTGCVPVEYNSAEFAAIRQATALGIHVVEAAGNGAQDLDSSTPPAGDPSYPLLFNVNDPNRNSGAILVGAADCSQRSVLSFSNRGRRVDAFSWGQDVTATGYGATISGPLPTCHSAPACDLFTGAPGDPRQDYTGCFSGTSSASAIIAAAVGAITGGQRTQRSTDASYPPSAVRRLLRTAGTPSANPTVDRIGRQPDLPDAFALLGLGPRPAGYYTGETQGDRFGSSVAGVGDVNGDGAPDIAVGAPYNDVGGIRVDAGRIYVYSGMTGDLIGTLSGRTAGDTFGWSIAGGADVDGDGRADILVGAPVMAGNAPGLAYLISGRALTTLRTFQGPSSGDQFGYAVDFVGDIDGDFREDLVIGATGSTNAYLYSGRTGNQILSTLSGFRYSVAGVGLVDGDAIPDVAVANGSYATVYSGRTGQQILLIGEGRAYHVARLGDVNGDGRADIVAGLSSYGQMVRAEAVVYSGTSGSRIYSITGSYVGPAPYVASSDDFDGDGRRDALIALDSYSSVGVYSGYNGLLVASFGVGSVGTSPRTWFSGVGDLNGDARGDIVIGNDILTNGTGRVYIFYGPHASLIARPGTVSASVGGMNNMAIDGGLSNTGQVYVILLGMSGAWPGIQIPGMPLVPLNLDTITFWALGNYGPPFFAGFIGTLDASGRSTAQFTMPGGFLVGLEGTIFSFAALTLPLPATFVSSPAAVRVIP